MSLDCVKSVVEKRRETRNTGLTCSKWKEMVRGTRGTKTFRQFASPQGKDTRTVGIRKQNETPVLRLGYLLIVDAILAP